MGIARARMIAGRMSVIIEWKNVLRRNADLWSKMKRTIMMRRRQIAKGKRQQHQKQHHHQKQQFPYIFRPHTPRGLKHRICKYARVERCGKASEVVARSGGETTNGFLPFHIIADNILLRLPVKSLARFRCVCKQWCSLIYSPCFAKGQLERAPETESPTFICSFSTYFNNIQFYNFIKLNDGGETIEGRTFPFKFGARGDHILSNSINGLVCAVYKEGSESERGCALFNPTTREVLPLPKFSINPDVLESTRMRRLGLGFDVSSGDYKLVQAHNISHPMSTLVHSRPQPLRSCVFKVLTVGSQEWRYVGETPCWVCMEHMVYLNGALHWLTINYNPGPQTEVILAFDMKDEKFRFISVPKVIPDYNYYDSLSLRKLEGHICLVKTPIRLPRNQLKLPPSLEIWKLEDYTNQGWKLEYDVDMSRIEDPYDCGIYTHIVDIICGKILMQKIPKMYTYDIHSRTWHELIEFWSNDHLHVLTESLISPSNLPVL